MAAAALGHAARRLGGSGALRQTAMSRLSSRLSHTEALPGCSCGQFEKDAAFKVIQKKKEELYEAVAEAHRKFGEDTDTASRTNRALLRQLSGHVSERTGDPTWEWARNSQEMHDKLKAWGFGPLIFAGCSYFF